MSRKNVIGDRYGLLTVIADAEDRIRRRGDKRRVQVCKCDCGTEVKVSLESLRAGHIISCNCEKVRLFVERKTTHGLSRHGLHGVWRDMKSRCLNHKSVGFEYYGGRGITVCSEWVTSFKSFYDFAINNGWVPGLEIDRVDNDGNYEPGNCRFVTRQVNQCNARKITSKNTTGYRGVSPKGRKFVVQVQYGGSVKYRKHGFADALSAAIHRDEYCIVNAIPLPLNFPRWETGRKKPQGPARKMLEQLGSNEA